MKTKNNLLKSKYLLGLGTGFLLAVLFLQLLPIFLTKTKTLGLRSPFVLKTPPSPTPDLAKQQQELAKTVMPEKFNLGVSFGDSIVKMVQTGVIDKEKFLKLYEGRGGLTEEEKKLLEEPQTSQIIVDQKNSNLILNLLWGLGIANKTNVLSEGPMGTQYKKDVANFASTGGWTLGRDSGGNLFNRFSIIPLTPEQEAQVKEIAENIYRPCCGNSTYFPDCNHGAAMLAFIEMAVAQGMSKEEIYKKALVLNSYWFPQTYVELATYFKAKKNISWDKVDPKELLGQNYSSGQGYQAVNKQLQSEGLLPKVEGGGGCGV